jgi:hypothetical protein
MMRDVSEYKTYNPANRLKGAADRVNASADHPRSAAAIGAISTTAGRVECPAG